MTSGDKLSEFKESISFALVSTTRTAGQIANEDLSFHRSSNPSIVPLLEQQSSRLLQLARKLTWTASKDSDIVAPALTDGDSMEDDWKGTVDILDCLLEKADACLDEYTGVIKRLSPDQEGKSKSAVAPSVKQKPDKIYRTKTIAKPQLLFEHVPSNDNITPFKPFLHMKPHAIKPLEACLTQRISEDGLTCYEHPYETEIKESRYPAPTFVKCDPIPYLPYESTTATFVDTGEAVASMLQDLKAAREIAIDLEHHDEHSYIGLVSLMQISTREKDWIIDTLRPWRRELQILNEVFADPAIVKVFHGAYMDMIWLQRDLGLYVVGLFDTFHASRALGYPRHSLAYLLKRFVDFDAAKQYQMADWRIRPLPEEMFNYARSDTHFLLYIYDNIRNELIGMSDPGQPDGNLIESVMNSSKEESLQRYESPRYDEQNGTGSMGWFNVLSRTPAMLDREQFAVFRAVHKWRDNVARQEDESVHLIMPKHVLLNIAREMPIDMPSLLACSHPMSNIFQKKKKDLLEAIKHAKSNGANGPDMKTLMSTGQSSFSKFAMKANPPEKGQLHDVGPTHHASHLQRQRNLMAKAEKSRFWGPIACNNLHASNLQFRINDDNLRLALPMPELSAEIFQDHNALAKHTISTLDAEAGALPEHQYIKERKQKQDNVFVVRQDGGSRKRKVSDQNMAFDSLLQGIGKHPEGSSVDTNSEPVDSAASRSGTTKEEKKNRKAERNKQQNPNPMNDEAARGVEPYNYNTAPSVLHAKPIVDGKAQGVNPYTKASDAPKAMRKSHREVTGKSFTYNG